MNIYFFEDVFEMEGYVIGKYHNNMKLVLQSLSGKIDFNEWECVGEEDAHGENCVCSHYVATLYIMRHARLGFSISVGSKCFTLFGGSQKKIKQFQIDNGKIEGIHCECGCLKKLRKKSYDDDFFIGVKKKYQKACLERMNYYKCFDCRKYKNYNCKCKTASESLNYNIDNIIEHKILNMENKNNNEDYEFMDTKLKDYVECKAHDLSVGQHFRYTTSVYQNPDKRKCCYAILKERKEDDTLTVEGYQSTYDPWSIDPNNRFKKFRFYKKE